mgnify:CR=1 FL=1
MPAAIVMENVRKTFGPKVAVAGLDLSVEEGGLYGFIGPNGAGKTTSIRMVMSIIFPDSGRLSVLGKASATESKDQIGYLPEERGVYRKMKVGAFLAYMAKLKGVDSGSSLAKTIEDWLERVGLADVRNKRCEELSKGMQQKVQFIACVLHEPELLILDEPFSGLDPVNMRLMRDLFLEQHQAGRTMIFSTHVMHQAEQLCDHIVMINNGQKVLDATRDEIKARHEPDTIAFEPVDPLAQMSEIERVPGVVEVTKAEVGYEARFERSNDPWELLTRISQTLPMQRVEVRRPTLEDVFIELAKVDDEDAMRAELAGQKALEVAR